MLWLAILLLLAVLEAKQEEPSCASPDNLASEDSCLSQPPITNACSGEVQLQNVMEAGLDERCKEKEEGIKGEKEEKGDKGENESGCLFLLETSTRPVLTSREACALESAARNSGLHIREEFPYPDLSKSWHCQEGVLGN